MTHRTRLATLSDVPALSQLFDSYRQFYEQEPDLAQATAFISARMQQQESVIFVTQADTGELIGFCQLYPTFCSVLAQPIFTLYDLFVTPAARQQGVAKQLMLAAEAHAVASGKARLDLTTARTNLAAQALYKSMGWVQDEVFLTFNRYPQAPSPHAQP